MFFITSFCVAVGFWFLYDGAFGFPKKNEVFTAHKSFVEEGRAGEWPRFAKSRGWDSKPPERLYGPADLMGQFALGAVSLMAGLCTIIWMSMCWRRKLSSDTEAVYSDTGVRVPFEAMRSVDRKKWESKGIAVVFYEADGKKRKLVLDDYKYIGGEQILNEVEQHLASRFPAES